MNGDVMAFESSTVNLHLFFSDFPPLNQQRMNKRENQVESGNDSDHGINT
jgi:hypothetical protein